MDHYQQLLKRYGDLVEKRDRAQRVYAALEIAVMETSAELDACCNGEMNAIYHARKGFDAIPGQMAEKRPTLPDESQP